MGDWHVLWDTVLDPFMMAHLLGHFGHALILRDWVLCTVISVGFEILECSLQHILPNFQECWWDHLILDILGMNLVGIVFGLLTVRFFSDKKYNWIYPGAEQLADENEEENEEEEEEEEEEDGHSAAGGDICDETRRVKPTLTMVARQFTPRQVRC